jgi:hypothetical protein
MARVLNSITLELIEGGVLINYFLHGKFNKREPYPFDKLEETILPIMEGSNLEDLSCTGCNLAVIFTPRIMKALDMINSMSLDIPEIATVENLRLPDLSPMTNNFKLYIRMKNPSNEIKAVVKNYIQGNRRYKVTEKSKMYRQVLCCRIDINVMNESNSSSQNPNVLYSF